MLAKCVACAQLRPSWTIRQLFFVQQRLLHENESTRAEMADALRDAASTLAAAKSKAASELSAANARHAAELAAARHLAAKELAAARQAASDELAAANARHAKELAESAAVASAEAEAAASALASKEEAWRTEWSEASAIWAGRLDAVEADLVRVRTAYARRANSRDMSPHPQHAQLSPLTRTTLPCHAHTVTNETLIH